MNAAAGKPPFVPFDQFQRYRFIQRVLEILVDDETGLLEVGASYSPLRYLMPSRSLVSLDLTSSPNLDLRADGMSLPFKPDSFDIVICTDVLEHLDASDRSHFIAELARVCSEALIIGFPHNALLVELADRTLFEFIRVMHQREYPFLKEHQELGLPDVHEVKDMLKRIMPYVYQFENASLYSWLVLQMAEFMLQKEPEFQDARFLLNEFFNRYHEAASHHRPCYRTFFVCFKKPVPYSVATSLNALPDAAPEASGGSDTAAVNLLLLTMSFYGALRNQQSVAQDQFLEARRELERACVKAAIFEERIAEIEDSRRRKEQDNHELQSERERLLNTLRVKGEEWTRWKDDMEERESQNIQEMRVLRERLAASEAQSNEATVRLASEARRYKEQAAVIENQRQILALLLNNPGYRVYKFFNTLFRFRS